MSIRVVLISARTKPHTAHAVLPLENAGPQKKGELK
jgi:hypothetical protein